MPSVIYLTDTRYGQRGWLHPSARHRCHHYADALLADGYDALVVPLDRVTPRLIRRFDHAVFHRPQYHKRFLKAYQLCRDEAVGVHADFDDLVFDPDIASDSPLYLNGGRDLAQVQSEFQATADAVAMFDSLICSTQYLKQRLQQRFATGNITVLPNSLPRLFQSPVIGRQKTKGGSVVGYFPGSRGHEADIASISEELRDVLGGDTRLLIVGRWNRQSVELPNVVHLPFSNYNRYLQLLSQADVSIAPLQDNSFNRAKSAVKLIESVAVGTPIVATAIPDMLDHDNALATMVTADGDWSSAIRSALADSGDAASISSVAQDLAARFSVMARLGIVKEHFGWTA